MLAQHMLQSVSILTAAVIVYATPLLPLESDPDAHGYLQKFGYLQKPNPETGSIIDHEHFADAVKTFQTFANLPITGVLDAETKRMMAAPRCGVPDVVDGETPPPSGQTHKRRKRFVLQGSKWKVKDLTWSVSQMTSQLNRGDVESQLARAWKIWSDNSDLTFTKSNGGNVHIDVRFAKFEHGDGDPFDGPGKTLAHAYFPQYGGDAHFDESESWTTGRYGTNLFQVAAHEFGHSLGLSHSNVRSSLMAPFYRGYDDNLQLDPDDIAAIQDIYGPPSFGRNRISVSQPASTPAPPPTRPPAPTAVRPRPYIPQGPGVSVCQSPTVDAITVTADGITYAFKDDMYYQLTDYGVEIGYPRKIAEDWFGLPGKLDAALTWSDGKTFFFKGDKYWRFENKIPKKGYPKSISKGFAGIPNDIDAAFVWSGNGNTYFIKGTQYWRYDSTASSPVSSDYPKSLSTWSGLPPRIDAAFQWKNGKTFFFSGPNYYRFNDKKFAVEADYPRPNDVWWFGCRSDNKKDFVASGNTIDSVFKPLSARFPYHPWFSKIVPSYAFPDNHIDDAMEELNDMGVRPKEEQVVNVSVDEQLPVAHAQMVESHPITISASGKIGISFLMITLILALQKLLAM
ncbi:stromelysin-3-like [Paramacrobiotus metropolitanus]|uniref:stromelysin-3-like n=1 Tax=Paramacrobiotus metropolitanus TaxID=2943436 RepID=UPI0024465D44|nr:stromelysin-3-like [Paramacrobiotus metropolitanus]